MHNQQYRGTSNDRETGDVKRRIFGPAMKQPKVAEIKNETNGPETLMRDLMMLTAINNFNVTIKHIAGIDNGIADTLSRSQISRFHSIAPYAVADTCSVPSFDYLQVLFHSSQ